MIPEAQIDVVSLLPLLPEHVSSTYVGWLNDPVTSKFVETSGDHTLETAEQYVSDANAAADAVIWRIVVDQDRHIGNIRLSKINQRHQRSEIALLIGERDEWGKGIATIAIGLASDYAFEKLGLEKITATIRADNIGSQKAFAKAGYINEATLLEHVFFEGIRYDVIVMCKFARKNAAA